MSNTRASDRPEVYVGLDQPLSDLGTIVVRFSRAVAIAIVGYTR